MVCCLPWRVVIPLPHQLHVLNRAMESNNIRYILADEVGLERLSKPEYQRIRLEDL